MSKGIKVSDDYHWSASAGLHEWVTEYLLARVRDPVTRTRLREVVDLNLPGVDLRQLPKAGRQEVLAALRGNMAAAARTDPQIITPEPERSFLVGHVKVLTLMANDVVGSEGDGGAPDADERDGAVSGGEQNLPL